jgi:polyhydroxyalkanoate synthesis repressor PhaR
MTKPEDPIVIRKYPNRRLYNTGTSTYIALEYLADMIRQGEDFVVYDAKSGEDITRSVVTQIHVTSLYHPIIVEHRSHGQARRADRH